MKDKVHPVCNAELFLLALYSELGAVYAFVPMEAFNLNTSSFVCPQRFLLNASAFEKLALLLPYHGPL